MHDGYLFTDEMKKDFICHPTADAPRFNNEGETLSDVYGKHSDGKEAAFRYYRWIFNKYKKYQAFDFAIRYYLSFYAPYGIRGYLYNRLKEEGHISFFTEYSAIAEYYNGVNGVNNA